MSSNERLRYMADVRRYRTALSKFVMRFSNAVMDGKVDDAEEQAFEMYQMMDDMIERCKEKPSD